MDSSPVGCGENQIVSDTCLVSSFITIIFPAEAAQLIQSELTGGFRMTTLAPAVLTR